MTLRSQLQRAEGKSAFRPQNGTHRCFGVSKLAEFFRLLSRENLTELLGFKFFESQDILISRNNCCIQL